MAVAEAVLLIAASFKIPEFNLPLKPKTKGRKKGFLFKGNVVSYIVTTMKIKT